MASLHVIVGPMFAGKTEELQRLYRRALKAKRRVMAFVPTRDVRSNGRLLTHAGIALNATSVSTSESLLCAIPDVAPPDDVFIDEVQFFDHELGSAVYHLVNRRHISVVVAGLLRDYRGAVFEATQDVLSQADTMRMLDAVCVVCANPATFTHRIVPSGERLQPAGSDAYEARCRECWLKVVLAPWRPE